MTYGYNGTQGQLPEQDTVPAYLDEDNNINPKYLEIQTASDLQFLKEWFEQNNSIHAKIGWIITVVNKYDLWSNDKDDALAYYSEDGQYGKKIANAIGNAKYTAVLACGAPDNMAQFRNRTANVKAVSAKDVALQNGLFIDTLAQKLTRGE